MLSIGLTPIGTYDSGIFDDSGAEVVAHDPVTQRLFVTNSADETVDVLDIADPANPTKEIFTLGVSGSPTSVAVHDGLVAVSVPATDKTDPGTVAFFTTAGTLINTVTVGALPDMVTFTPDGTKVLVANEGEPNDAYDVDPEGSVSIIDVSSGAAAATVATADFTAFNALKDELREAGVRIFGPGATVAEDVEPEYIAVDADSKTAWVALQENNAIAILDIDSATFTSIKALGYKDHLLPGSGLDASNKDKAINITDWPIKGMFQPDGMAAYDVGGETFLITANEGDGRDYDGFSEEARVKDVLLGGPVFAQFGRKDLQENENLGRLKVTTAFPSEQRGNNGSYHELYAYGTRSFSIWDAAGNLVFDSGDDFEQITAAALPGDPEDPEDLGDFNSTNDENDSFDNRSDDKGPEPEAVVVADLGDQTYAFIGLERVGGIMVYDVTNPTSPTFESYVNRRDFSKDAQLSDGSTNPDVGDLAPEGLKFISAADSPIGTPLLAVANEVSGTTTVFTVGDVVGSVPGAVPVIFTSADWLAALEELGDEDDSKSDIVDLLMITD